MLVTVPVQGAELAPTSAGEPCNYHQVGRNLNIELEIDLSLSLSKRKNAFYLSVQVFSYSSHSDSSWVSWPGSGLDHLQQGEEFSWD